MNTDPRMINFKGATEEERQRMIYSKLLQLEDSIETLEKNNLSRFKITKDTIGSTVKVITKAIETQFRRIGKNG